MSMLNRLSCSIMRKAFLLQNEHNGSPRGAVCSAIVSVLAIATVVGSTQTVPLGFLYE